jgi:hypothetical protein
MTATRTPSGRRRCRRRWTASVPHIRDARQQPRVQQVGRGVVYLGDTLGCGLAEAFPREGMTDPKSASMEAVRVSLPRNLRGT